MAIKIVDIVPEPQAKEPKPKPKAPKPAKALKPKPGRPLASEAHLTLERTKPWEALGMSRRTWYRRQKEPKA